MPVETPSGFAQVIQDHLELKRQNAELDSELPIERYKGDDPFGNHPLFKSTRTGCHIAMKFPWSCYTV